MTDTTTKPNETVPVRGAPIVQRPVSQPAPGRVTRPIVTAPADPFPGRVTR